MPNWFDVTPRFGVSYDLFGNAKTALKGTINRYMAGQTLATRSATTRSSSSSRPGPGPMRTATTSRRTSRSGRATTRRSGSRVRTKAGSRGARLANTTSRTSLGIQHELLRGLSVSGSWFRRSRHNELRSDNLRVGFSDYAPVQVLSPLDGEVFTVYNLDPPSGPRSTRSTRTPPTATCDRASTMATSSA